MKDMENEGLKPSGNGYTKDPELGLFFDILSHLIPQDDITFYENVCKNAGIKVLELACGTGRVSIPLAQRGFQMMGIDQSKAMLDRLNDKVRAIWSDNRPIKTKMQNMSCFAADCLFDAILIPFRSFEHLTNIDDQIGCLSCVHRHLKESGLLALDIYDTDIKRLSLPLARKNIEDIAWVAMNDGRLIRRKSVVTSRQLKKQLITSEIEIQVQEKNGTIRSIFEHYELRYFFRYEMEHLLARCGFKVLNVYGGFHGESISEESSVMVFVAQKSV